MEFVKAGLSIWVLTWALSFWHKLDPLRERLGVQVVSYDAGHGQEWERVDYGGIGAWLNCPMCTAVLAALPGWWLRGALAPLGLALIIVRWWEAARPKAKWWL